MKSLAITEFKAKCLAVLEEVARTESPVTVTRRGKALARVIPVSIAKDGVSEQASLLGTIHEVEDDGSSVLPTEDWDMNREPRKARRRG